MTLFKDKYRVESARLPGYDYSSAGWYFITICTGNRIKYFGDIVVDLLVPLMPVKMFHRCLLLGVRNAAVYRNLLGQNGL